MLSAESQVLLRNRDIFAQGKWLLVNPTDSHVASQLVDADIEVFHQYFDLYQSSQQQGGNHHFGPAFEQGTEFDGAVIYMPKSKAQLKMLIANMAYCVKAGGSVLLVGENKGGIKGGAKLLEMLGAGVQKVDSARHCGLFATANQNKATQFALAQWETHFDVVIGECQYKVCSLPGVFNHGALDIGTKLLLDNLPALGNGRMLDFGCGAGVIGCYLALQNSAASVVMTDVSALAVYCAKRSSELNGVTIEVLASNGLSEVSGKFAAVVTNPPFHTGIKTDYSVTEGFIQSVGRHLGPSGRLLLVANRFLRYSELLEQRFKSVELLEQTTKFSFYQCNRAS